MGPQQIDTATKEQCRVPAGGAEPLPYGMAGELLRARWERVNFKNSLSLPITKAMVYWT